MRHVSHQLKSRHGSELPLLAPAGLSLVPQWHGPTFGEFVDRVRHQFGSTADLDALLLMGMRRDEALAPSDIEALCSQLGIPPEDFGVDP